MLAVRNIHEFRPFVHITNFDNSEYFATYGMPDNPLYPDKSVLYTKAIEKGCCYMYSLPSGHMYVVV